MYVKVCELMYDTTMYHIPIVKNAAEPFIFTLSSLLAVLLVTYITNYFLDIQK